MNAVSVCLPQEQDALQSSHLGSILEDWASTFQDLLPLALALLPDMANQVRRLFLIPSSVPPPVCSPRPNSHAVQSSKGKSQPGRQLSTDNKCRARGLLQLRQKYFMIHEPSNAFDGTQCFGHQGLGTHFTSWPARKGRLSLLSGLSQYPQEADIHVLSIANSGILQPAGSTASSCRSSWARGVCHLGGWPDLVRLPWESAGDGAAALPSTGVPTIATLEGRGVPSGLLR